MSEEWTETGTFKFYCRMRRFLRWCKRLRIFSWIFKKPDYYLQIIISRVQEVKEVDDRIVEQRDELHPVNMAVSDTFMINFMEPGTEDVTSSIMLSFKEEGIMVLRTYKEVVAKKRAELEKKLEPDWVDKVRTDLQKASELECMPESENEKKYDEELGNFK